MSSSSGNAVDLVRTRIRADLREAMRAKRMDEVAVLRTLIGALDNAEAITVAPERYTERAFGDPATEVPRKQLSAEEVAAVLETEQREKLTVAEELERAGRAADAVKLRDAATIVSRYIAG